MRLIVKKPFKLRHPDGYVLEYHVGDEITLEASETVHRLFDGGYIELPMTEGRRRSLEMCMDATMFEAMREIQASGYWKMTPEVEEIEKDVHETYQAVLKGLKKLSDYRAQVERWQKAGTIH